MLVILTGEIANERLPLQLKLPLPDGADVPLGIGHSDTTTNLSPLPEVRESGKRWVDVRMVKQEFQIEFYYNPFSEGNQREGEYIFQLNHPLEEYHVAIQQPLGGENFRFSENLGKTTLHGSAEIVVSLPVGRTGTVALDRDS